ncbi:hypothetical protein EC957_007135 [Mortierella hygrophila]|uniref:Uncharacterized protein n=1 Tax=Mortierella hygrophila TaxID=979708 RepID=A0A9P6JYV3_9FUNG|nr:hypothetical protein EC957_007135 [Mortierella hygrophila]
MEQKEAKERHPHALHVGVYKRETVVTKLHTKDILLHIGAGQVASSTSKTSSASTSPSLNSISAAGKKHPRELLDEQDEASSEADRNAQEDLEELQSTKIATRGHQFFFVFRALYDLHNHRSLKMPPRPSNLTDIQGKLFTFIVSKLPQFHLLKRVQKKDIFVASSMIAHLEHDEAEDVFGKDTLDELAPLIVDEEFSAADDEVKAILKKVEKAAMLGNRKFDPRRARLCATKELGLLAGDELNGITVDEHKVCILEILRLLARKCERPFVDIPKETESMTVHVWEDVFDLLFQESAVYVTTGETGLVASREEREANEQAHGRVQVPVSPRKVDFLLLTSVEHQRKLVHIEIADYEHKGPLASDEDVAVQLRKSIRHNHAILTRLPVLDQIIFLDIKGYTARVMRLRRLGSVFVCGTMADEIVLPATPAQLKHFLDGRSLSALFRLREHVLEAAFKVQESVLQPKRPPLLARTVTPPPAPKTPTFYTPTAKRNK